MRNPILTILLLSSLFGCASHQKEFSQYNNWQQNARPNGPQDDWLSYYKQAHLNLQQLPEFNGKADLVLAKSVMVTVSRAYKEKTISWAEFQRNQRNIESTTTELIQRLDKEGHPDIAAALRRQNHS